MLGLISLLTPRTPWKLISLDDDFPFYFIGEFEPEGFQISKSSNISKTNIANSNHPIIQWISNNARTVTFEGFARAKFNWNIPDVLSVNRLINEDINTDKEIVSGGDIDRFWDHINRIDEKLEKLGRNPHFQFNWGNKIFMDCIVESNTITATLYEKGFLETIKFSVTLTSLRSPYDGLTPRVETGMSDLPPVNHESLVHYVKEGETYESIALDHYGDPIYGVLLRNRNIEHPIAQEASYIKIVDRDHPDMLEPIEPQSIMFKYSEEQDVAFKETLDARNAMTLTSYILQNSRT